MVSNKTDTDFSQTALKKREKKVCPIVAQQKKMLYICITKTEDSDLPTLERDGAVVQLVRIHACHAWGRGFESRPHRSYKTPEVKNFGRFYF